jgi:beta-galactosidase
MIDQWRFMLMVVLCGVLAVPAVARVEVADAQPLRVTPPVTSVAGLADYELSLDGAWGFIRDVPEGFDPVAPDAVALPSTAWREVEVPGHFSLQGHGRMHEEFGVPVAYVRTVVVPESWRGCRVLLRFESVEGHTRVYVNGTKVGERDTHYLPLELDVTDAITPGEQARVLVMISASSITQWWRAEKGGIRRSVRLMALPPLHLAGLNVTTRIDPSGDATMQITYRAVPLETDSVTLPALAPHVMRRGEISVPVRQPALWNTDHPSLYRLTATLSRAGEPTMTAERQFGFRELRVEGNRLLFNGVPIHLRGVNFHQTWPGMDYATPPDKLRIDMELFQSANLDYLRIWPPPDSRVVEMADEIGMMMQVELPISMFIYRGTHENNFGNDPAYEPTLHQWAELMVEHYASHPSVIIWSLGNECFYYDFFRSTADVLRGLDPSRPIIFSGDRMTGVGVEGVDVNDDHYPRHGRIDWTRPDAIADASPPGAKLGWFRYPTDRPLMFSEWLHLPGSRVEQDVDPGTWDFFGELAEAHVRFMLEHDHVVGGAIFKGTPVTAIHENVLNGLYDEHRRPNAAWWHAFKAMSPVRVEPTGRSGPSTALNVRNLGNFAALDAYRFVYRQGDAAGEARASSAPPGQAGDLELPIDADGGVVELDVFGPHGRLVDRYRFASETDAVAWRVFPRRGLDVRTDGPTVRIAGEGFAWGLDTARGLIMDAEVDGGRFTFEGPRLSMTNSAWHENHRLGLRQAMQQLVTEWTPHRHDIERAGDHVVVRFAGRYPQGEGTWTLTFDDTGGLLVEYAFVWTDPREIDLYDAGVRFTTDARLDTLHWTRDAMWCSYPDDHIGRPVGVAQAWGDPRWAAARAATGEGDPPPWPWAQDLTAGGVTRDFRSTRAHIRQARLVDAEGAGIGVVGEAASHLRMDVHDETDAFVMHVNRFWSGGNGFHQAISLRGDTLRTGPGMTIQGAARFQLLATDAPAAGPYHKRPATSERSIFLQEVTR